MTELSDLLKPDVFSVQAVKETTQIQNKNTADQAKLGKNVFSEFPHCW